YSTSSLILKIIVTTTPITVKATPISNIVAEVHLIVPKKGTVNSKKTCFKKGSPKKTDEKPEASTMNTPVAPTFLKSTGSSSIKVSITKTSKMTTNAHARTNRPTTP